MKLFEKKKIRKPDYIIIGTQKGGTTTLFHQLSQHPCIDNPTVKEIHYFDLKYNTSPDNYWSCFKDCKQDRITGEASPYYLFHPHVAGRIKKHIPDVKLIVMLRNPVSRAYSHYQMSRKKGLETLSFEEAILQEAQRVTPLYEEMIRDENKNYKEVQFYSYLSRGNYAMQLKHWLQYFGRKNFLFIESEEYYKDAENKLEKIHSFLGIDYVKPKDLDNQFKGEYDDNLDAALIEKFSRYFKEINRELPELTGRSFSWL